MLFELGPEETGVYCFESESSTRQAAWMVFLKNGLLKRSG